MNRRKYIVIGEASLEIRFDTRSRATACAGGTFLQIARELARNRQTVMFISEIGLDPAGELIASTLSDAGVDISCCDRFTEANTPLSLTIGDRTSRYQQWAEADGFDVTWPRIEKEDVVVFGGYMSLDPRVRKRLWALVSNAVERNATVVYIPGVDDARIPRITRVMPIVFENLESASLVITIPGDLDTLYSTSDPEKAYRNNISFYSQSMAAIGIDNDEIGRAHV